MILEVLSQLIGIIIISYALFTVVLILLWNKPRKIAVNTSLSGTSISVLIPVRNEEKNILALLRDLSRQTLPPANFEVIVIDDASDDTTPLIVTEFAKKAPYPLTLLALPDKATSSPKKRAIETAMLQARGELIVTTDGDCRVGPGWLAAIVRCYNTTHARLISGPVTFTQEELLTDHLQTVEFASLIGSGACAIAAGRPTMCNGANLIYPKSVFREVGGFEGSRHIASGDDEFLLHKIAAKFPGEIYFLKEADAIVQTQPHREWSRFYSQRKRWASKWKHYKTLTPVVLAIYIFFTNLSLIGAVALALSGAMSLQTLGVLVLLKWGPEWFFLGGILHFLGKSRSIFFIPLVQLIYPFYVCLFGLVSQKPTYDWKGRKLA